MIKIERTNLPKSEEYINENRILRCWKEKDVVEKMSYKVFPLFTSDLLFHTGKTKIDEHFDITIYKTDDNDFYAFRQWPTNDIYNALIHVGDIQYGWNKLEITPEKWYYRYYIEVEASTLETNKEGHWYTVGFQQEHTRTTETIEVNRATFRRIIPETPEEAKGSKYIIYSTEIYGKE